jgi:trehalose 2-sulfotransferase
MEFVALMTKVREIDAGEQIYEIFPPSQHQREVETHLKGLPDPYQFDAAQIAPTKGLFLCFTNRSGSTLLADQMAELGLFSTQVMHDNFEYLTGGNVITFMRRNRLNTFGEFLAKAVATYRSPQGWFSTKISLDQLVWLTRKGVMARVFPGSLFIHIRRDNVVAQAVSFSIAAQTKRWSAPAKSAAPAPPEPKELVFDPVDIARHVRNIMQTDALFSVYFELHDIDPIAFSYEEIVRQPTIVRSRLEERLGMPLVPIAEQVLGLTKQGDALNEEWEIRFRCLFPKVGGH